MHILVAEDNEFNSELLKQLLALGGHQVTLATHGRDALLLALEGTFDLLLLDLHMPEMDGFQVVKEIRERERITGRYLPVIALTARSRKEDRQRCLDAGMDDFLSKPIQTPALWAAIAGVRQIREAGDQPEQELLDSQVLLAACGGDGRILQKICQTFQSALPAHWQAVRVAIQDQDARRVREAAHKLCGMVSAFSTAAAKLASDIEDHAASDQLTQAQPLTGRLEPMIQELLQLAGGLTIDKLRQMSAKSKKTASLVSD
jgi:CheY-like chemotaxis protein